MKNSVLLRHLKEKDAFFMYEWMCDPEITRNFSFAIDSMVMEHIRKFIEESQKTDNNLHFAIADDENDEYYGTVSLKNINIKAESAEYAIVLRKKVQGKGYAYIATREILDYAFFTLNLERVYLNVLSANFHAVNFYEKIGFIYEGEFLNHLYIHGTKHSLKWFRLMKSEYIKIRERLNDNNQ